MTIGLLLLAALAVLAVFSDLVKFLLAAALLVLIGFLLVNTNETLIWLRDAAEWVKNLG